MTHRSVRRIPWGVVGALVLIAFIEFGISRQWLFLSDPVGLSWRFSSHAATTMAPGSDLICLGDSLIKHGVFPRVMESVSGLHVSNLSAARCPTLMSYYLFAQALRAGARPKAIVVDAKPAVLLGDPDYNSAYWPYALSLENLLDFAGRTQRPQLIASSALAQLFPSIRSRLQLRSNIVAALEGGTDKLHDINPVLWRNWSVNSGANVAQSHPSFDGELPADVNQKLHPDIFFVARSNRDAIGSILELAADHGIRVYFLLAPISPALQALRDRSGAEAQYEEFLEGFQHRYPQQMIVLDGRRAGFSNPDFIDATHLNARGGVTLSRSLAAAITNDLKSPHASISKKDWISLAAPTTSIEGPSIEDLGQTRTILQNPR